MIKMIGVSIQVYASIMIVWQYILDYSMLSGMILGIFGIIIAYIGLED